MFQFHKGSIKTKGEVTMIFNRYMFQFHKGSIKTAYAPRNRTSPSSFNSIKVRLRLEIGDKVSNQSHMFQFHKGSIKT